MFMCLTLSDDGIAFSDDQLLNLEDVVLSCVEASPSMICFPDMQTADGPTGFLGGHLGPQMSGWRSYSLSVLRWRHSEAGGDFTQLHTAICWSE